MNRERPPAGAWRFAVRPAGPFDIPLLAALHAQSFAGTCAGQAWDETALAEILAMPGAYGLIAGTDAAGDSVPTGFLIGHNVAETGEILSLGVSRAWRRRGVARCLLRAAVATAAAAGLTRLFLEVAEDNDPARELYGGEGFAAIARRPAYYRRSDGPAVTALVLARDLA
jgi:ribosomal-protein-alanine N-acetyltransferase